MKASGKMIEIKAVGVFFFSHGDERAFLGWLDAMPFVERLDRSGRTLHIFINDLAVDEDGLRDLLALFRWYEVQGLRQLAAFDRDEFADWFRDKEKYWYEEIFG